MEPKKRHIAIIAGGDSSEYPVSIRSARNILNNMDQERFNPRIVEIRQQEWSVWDHNEERYPINRHDFSWTENGNVCRFDAIFNCIHGTPGENGLIQSYAQLIGIPITGCAAFTSSLTFNKYYCNQFLKQCGIQAAPSVLLRKNDTIDARSIVRVVGIPCVVKPNNGGSSCGSSLVKSEENLQPAIDQAFNEDNEVIIESYLKGIEITCGLLNSSNGMVVFPLTQVVSKKDFFDFEAKYTPGMADEITPAPLPDEQTRSIKDLSASIYQLLGCRGVVRMDYILVDNTPYFLEVNTVPGMTHESVVPKQAASQGLSLTSLISLLLDEAIAR